MLIPNYTKNFETVDFMGDTKNYKSFFVDDEKEEFFSFSKMIKKFNKNLSTVDCGDIMGTSTYYKHWTNNLVYTDGVKNFCEKFSAYWLLDLVASYVHQTSNIIAYVKNGIIDYKENPKGKDYFINCHLIKLSDNKAVFTMDIEDVDGEEKTLIFQEINYTDIDCDYVNLWLENGILITPNEH